MLLACGLAWLYRSTDLGKRPMHTDEAILAIKTAHLMKTGEFDYDPKDYHGPLLHYSALAFGKLCGWNADNITESRLRFVTAVYGMGLILIALLLTDVLTRPGSVVAAALIAASPMMNFYSRYYIMETPMVFFCGLFLASLWRWSQSRNILWLVVAGVSLGAMHAAKETFVLNVAAMALSYAMVRTGGLRFDAPRGSGYMFGEARRKGGVAPWIVVPLFAAVTSVLLYSGFFRDWSAVRDSVLTYKSYVHRSGGEGHAKPWHYYLTLLFWTKNPLQIWTEALTGALALLGMFNAFFNSGLPRHHRAFLVFLSLYSLGVLAIYSIIPYKTPWTILSADHALVLLAGAGAAAFIRGLPALLFRIVAVLALLVGIYNLCHQTTLAIDYNRERIAVHSARDLNPYVYSHTTPKIPELAHRVHELAALHPDGAKMRIEVIQAENGWPLPWYLRDLKNVGYSKDVPDDLDSPPIIIADSVNQEKILAHFAPKAAPVEEPDPSFVGPPAPLPPTKSVTSYEQDEPRTLRTHADILLNVFVEKSLWEKYQISREHVR